MFFRGPKSVHDSPGLRPSIDLLGEAVEAFLHHCRPRGKKLPTRAWEPIQLAEHYMLWHGYMH